MKCSIGCNLKDNRIISVHFQGKPSNTPVIQVYTPISNAEEAEVGKHKRKLRVKVTQLCPTLCDPMDYRVHRILQARTWEWVAFPFSRGSSQPRDQTQVSCIAGRFFTSCPIRKAWELYTFLIGYYNKSKECLKFVKILLDFYTIYILR